MSAAAKKKAKAKAKRKARNKKLRDTHGGLARDVIEGKWERIPNHAAEFALGMKELVHGQIIQGVKDAADSIFVARKRRQRRVVRNQRNARSYARSAAPHLSRAYRPPPMRGDVISFGPGGPTKEQLRQQARLYHAQTPGFSKSMSVPSQGYAPGAVGTRFRHNNFNMKEHVIQHSDVIDASVDMASDYTLTEFIMNPGNSRTFPWGNRIFRCFELFRILALEFEWCPSAASAETGVVALFWEPDWNDNPPTSLEELLNNEFSQGGSTWLNHKLTIPKRMFSPFNTNAKRIRDSDVDTTEQESHDFGRFYLATQGSTSTGVGSLVINYKIAASVPQYRQFNGEWTHITNDLAAGVGAAAKFTNAWEVAGSTLGGLGCTWTGNVFTFDPNMVGHFVVTYQISDSTSCTAPTISFTNCVGNSVFRDNTGSSQPDIVSPGGTASTASMLVADINLLGVGGATYFTITGTNTANAVIDMLIIQRPDDAYTFTRSVRRELEDLMTKAKTLERSVATLETQPGYVSLAPPTLLREPTTQLATDIEEPDPIPNVTPGSGFAMVDSRRYRERDYDTKFVRVAEHRV